MLLLQPYSEQLRVSKEIKVVQWVQTCRKCEFVWWYIYRRCYLLLRASYKRAHRHPAGPRGYGIFHMRDCSTFPFAHQETEAPAMLVNLHGESLLSGIIWNYPHRVHHAWHTATSWLSVFTACVLPQPGKDGHLQSGI